MNLLSFFRISKGFYSFVKYFNGNKMRYMWKYLLLLMLVITSCSEKQIDDNVINVAGAMSRLSEGQSVQICFPA